jgi:heparan sulfate 6-O-sulfotransferase HS6ST2
LKKIKSVATFLNNTHFITILRNPIIRFVSEWQHLRRRIEEGLEGKLFESFNVCNKELPVSTCYSNLESATIEKFLLCKSNAADNRQTRHLADYDQKNHNNCSLFQKENSQLLLKNAKNVLDGLSFFALTEYEELSHKLFEKTFGNVFKFNYTVAYSKYKYVTANLVKSLNVTILDKIKEANSLDIELYDYAKTLFFKRVQYLNITI